MLCSYNEEKILGRLLRVSAIAPLWFSLTLSLLPPARTQFTWDSWQLLLLVAFGTFDLQVGQKYVIYV
jgi:hypothetical protein